MPASFVSMPSVVAGAKPMLIVAPAPLPLGLRGDTVVVKVAAPVETQVADAPPAVRMADAPPVPVADAPLARAAIPAPPVFPALRRLPRLARN